VNPARASASPGSAARTRPEIYAVHCCGRLGCWYSTVRTRGAETVRDRMGRMGRRDWHSTAGGTAWVQYHTIAQAVELLSYRVGRPGWHYPLRLLSPTALAVLGLTRLGEDLSGGRHAPLQLALEPSVPPVPVPVPVPLTTGPSVRVTGLHSASVGKHRPRPRHRPRKSRASIPGLLLRLQLRLLLLLLSYKATPLLSRRSIPTGSAERRGGCWRPRRPSSSASLWERRSAL
jgi:hypothetical protein